MLDDYLNKLNRLAVKSFVQAHAYELLKIMPNLLLIYHRNATGTIAMVNNNWYQVMGYDEHEVVGESFLNFLHQEDVEPTLSFYTDSLNQPLPADLQFTNRYMAKDGAVITIAWNGSIELPMNTPLAAAVGKVVSRD